MANTVSGPYAPHSWTINDTANSTRLNNLETQASDAWHGFNPDLIGAGFVYSGVTCTKDGVTANQLDIAAGRAYVVFTDGTVGLVIIAADNTHTTSVINTTYFLDLNPDGTWSWGTSHSGVANHLTICSATTDASGNILVVTDARVLGATLFSGMAGTLKLAAGTQLELDASDGTHKSSAFTNTTGSGIGGLALFDVTGGDYIIYQATKTGFAIKGAIQNIGGQATAGSFGAPVIVAQAINQVISVTTVQTLISFTPPASGLYRANIFVGLRGTANSATATLQYHDPQLSSAVLLNFLGNSGGTSFIAIGSAGFPASWAGTPLVFYADATQAITIKYQNATGTPNDAVSCFLERLS